MIFIFNSTHSKITLSSINECLVQQLKAKFEYCFHIAIFKTPSILPAMQQKQYCIPNHSHIDPKNIALIAMAHRSTCNDIGYSRCSRRARFYLIYLILCLFYLVHVPPQQLNLPWLSILSGISQNLSVKR